MIYIALCIGLPVIWGVISARLFDWWQAKRRSDAEAADEAVNSRDMYYI